MKGKSISPNIIRLSIFAVSILLLLSISSVTFAFTLPEECTNTKEYWESRIRDRENEIARRRENLQASRNAHFDLFYNSGGLPGIGSFSGMTDSTMGVLANPNFTKMTPSQQANALAGAELASLQRQADPWRTPRAPGKNSLLADQTFAGEIPGLRSQIAQIQRYIDRCFNSAYLRVESVGPHIVTAWNCSGLSGQWNFQISNAIGYDFSGAGSFTLPVTPEGGPWRTPAFTYEMKAEHSSEHQTLWLTDRKETILEFKYDEGGVLWASVVMENSDTHYRILNHDTGEVFESTLPGLATTAGFLAGPVQIGGDNPACGQ